MHIEQSPLLHQEVFLLDTVMRIVCKLHTKVENGLGQNQAHFAVGDTIHRLASATPTDEKSLLAKMLPLKTFSRAHVEWL